MDRPSPEVVDCPHCGARNFAIDDDCAACRRGLTVFIGPRPVVRRVGLGSVMMVVAVVAVCLAPVRVAPGFCILFSCILLPATTRAILHIEGRKAEGRPMIVQERIGAFIISTIISSSILVLASTAFVAACVPTVFCTLAISGRNRPEPGIIVACIAGAVAALFAIYQLGRRLWPRKD